MKELKEMAILIAVPVICFGIAIIIRTIIERLFVGVECGVIVFPLALMGSIFLPKKVLTRFSRES